MSEALIDARRALASRIASSASFQKSSRLRELFLFLCERAILSPGTVVHEQEIGVEVFGRPADYDTSQDTVVRANVYQLRKKLQQYFEAEGRAEPMMVEIPRGVYTPVFCDRLAEKANEDHPAPAFVAGPASAPRSRLTFLFAGLALAGAVLSIWFAVRGQSRSSAPLGPGFGPTVDRVWLQVFGNGRNTSVVLADLDLAFFSHVTGREIDLHRYRAKEFDLLADETIRNPEQREAMKQLLRWYGTSVGDARTAARIAALHAIHGLPLKIVPARDFETSELRSNNIVLLGGTASNPWVELFHPKLRYFAPAKYKSGVEGYCRVALLPNIAGGGNILMLAGTDEASVAAGIDLVSNEQRVRQLRSALHLGEGDRIPFFEILLKVQVLAGSSAGLDIVSSRVVPA